MFIICNELGFTLLAVENLITLVTISTPNTLTLLPYCSAKFINDNKLSERFFRWQDSASAFSVSKSDVDKVCKYIINQPEHHKKKTFMEEYDELIRYYQRGLKWEIR